MLDGGADLPERAAARTADLVEILLIDDDPADILITREAFADNKLRNPLTILTDGAQAIAYLRRTGRYVDARLPDLVLLDLNLPRLDSRAVLDVIRADPELASIPVVVLTSSRVDEDILRRLRVPADAYMYKPVDFSRLVEMVRRMDTLYIQVEKISGRR